MSKNSEKPKETPDPLKVRTGSFTMLIIAALFMGLGLGVGIPRLLTAVDEREIVKIGVSATGEIIDVTFRSYKGRTSAVKEVVFQTPDGSSYEAEGRERVNIRTEGPREKIVENLTGTEVTVFYDPSDPDRNVLKDHERSLVDPIVLMSILALFGLVLGSIGLLGLANYATLIREQKVKTE